MSLGEEVMTSDKKRGGKKTPLEQLAKERRHARWFFWLWCGIATTLSIVANYLHLYADPIVTESGTAAAHTVELTKQQRGLVGVTAPLMLMMSLHGLWLMLKNTSTRGVPEAEVERPAKLWWLGAAGIGVVAVVAFYVSYTGLIVLARSAGMTEWQSNVYPLILDVPILVSLLALLIVRPIKAPASRTVQSVQSSAPRTPAVKTVKAETSVQAVSAGAVQPPVQSAKAGRERESVQTPAMQDTYPQVTGDAVQDVSPDLSSGDAVDAWQVTSDLLSDAAQVVQVKKMATPTDAVARALAMHRAGANQSQIESVLDLSYRTVKKIIDAAAEIKSEPTDDEIEPELVSAAS